MAVIGPNSDERSILLGNYNGWPSRYTTFYEGICDGAPESLRIYKAKGCDLIKDTPGGWAEQPLREALIVGGKSDVIVLCLGLRPDIEGEEGDAYNSDLGGDRRSIDLPSAQLRLFDELAKLDKPIVVVNSSGSAVNLSPLHDRAAAILHVWYPGQAGGTALADILFGRCSPSGKLPVTFYKSDDDLPDFRDYSMNGRTYRYMKAEPLYPFGFGLGYAHLSLVQASVDQGRIEDGAGCLVHVDVQNRGDSSAEDTVQIYLRQPDCPFDIPRLRLAAFEKVCLGPGENRTLAFTLAADQLRVIDEAGRSRHVPGRIEMIAAFSLPVERSLELGVASPISLFAELV